VVDVFVAVVVDAVDDDIVAPTAFALGLETGIAGRTGSTIGMIIFLCLIGGPVGLRGDFTPPFVPTFEARIGDFAVGGVGSV
jgi:hypothetical protein